MKIKLLQLTFVSLIAFCFTAGAMQWFEIKSQADIEQVPQNRKKMAQIYWDFKVQQGSEQIDTYEKLKETVKASSKVETSESAFSSYLLNIICYCSEGKAFINDFLADPDINDRYKMHAIVMISSSSALKGTLTKEMLQEYMKNNIVSYIACFRDSKDIVTNYKPIDYIIGQYIKYIVPVDDEKDVKKTLKSINKYLYPMIGDDDKIKALCVKIKLALDSLE